MTQEQANEINDILWEPSKSIDALADEAFELEREGNIHFWTIKNDDPEVKYWKAVWKKGYLKGLGNQINI